jgi:hypothetical protein
VSYNIQEEGQQRAYTEEKKTIKKATFDNRHLFLPGRSQKRGLAKRRGTKIQ